MLSVYTRHSQNARTATTSNGDAAAAPNGFRALPVKITSFLHPIALTRTREQAEEKVESLKKRRDQAHARRHQRSRLRRP